MLNIEYQKEYVKIKNVSYFELEQTLDCGQAFRWQKNNDGSWNGIAKGKCINISKEKDDIIIYGASKEEFEGIWLDYFDFSRNYESIYNSLTQNEILKKAAEYGQGIRILNQEPFETLCSFIISQNNNIPRIKGIIERLCENFGTKCGERYTFPDAKTLAKLTVDDLAVIRSGFRAKYIIDAAKKVASGEIDLDSLKTADIDTAREALMKIKGVGPKVADCVLLFSLSHINAFPKDVWIKRAMEVLFKGELPDCAKEYGGIAQQYIFYYARSGNLNV